MPMRPSTPVTRFQSPDFAVAMRWMAITPMRERAASSCWSRSTESDIAPAFCLRVHREVAFDAGQRVWRGGQDPAGRHAHPRERSRVRDLHQRELARNERPERFFILAADRAHEVESPRLLLTRSVAQCGEGNAEIGIPASRVH